MTRAIHCGTFESESHWRDPSLAKLPFIPDAAGTRLVESMDEMLFVFCGTDDRVMTARPMNEAHVAYLHEVGFEFCSNRFALRLDGDAASDGAPHNVFHLMTREPSVPELCSYLEGGGKLEPFAVLPGAAAAAQAFRLEGRFPALEVIRTVNTKSYSLDIRRRLGIAEVGCVVRDLPSLMSLGSRLLESGPVLIKDDFGVSGRGNQLVQSVGALNVVIKHLSRQVAGALAVQFVVEPFLPKQADFSCQFRVDERGATTLISVQRLLNNGLAFGTSCAASEGFMGRLKEDGYFELMARVGTELHRDGYFGDVCVDSMVLSDGTIFPLVEINARKSMSLIKHFVDRRLAKEGLQGSLTSVAVVNERNPSFSTFLQELRAEQILFNGRANGGVLPLTAGTLLGVSAKRGKLYLTAVCEGDEERVALMIRLGGVMERIGLRVIQ